MSSTAAIPGLTGIEHVGLGVPDIEAATRFFADVVGCEPIYDIGPFDAAQDWMAHHLAAGPGTRIHRMRVLKVADGPTVELIEFEGPDGRTPLSPSAPDFGPGGFHIAFYVEDMDAALAALKAHGTSILSGPVEMTEGPSAGLTWLYFRAPWGQQLELVSYPGGIAAYRKKRLQVWRPGCGTGAG
jgi:catechol 2,3-dioxygenase-like lactoylglutathione lyase family enzyme